MKNKITLIINKGIVRWCEDRPKDIEIEVHDYDIDGCAEEGLDEDEYEDKYWCYKL